MNCIEFQKNINSYIENSLTDGELNEFLHHLSSCPDCKDELEINYIVSEATKTIKNDNTNLNFKALFSDKLSGSNKCIHHARIRMIVTYCIETLVFWFLIAAVFVFIRITFL